MCIEMSNRSLTKRLVARKGGWARTQSTDRRRSYRLARGFISNLASRTGSYHAPDKERTERGGNRRRMSEHSGSRTAELGAGWQRETDTHKQHESPGRHRPIPNAVTVGNLAFDVQTSKPHLFVAPFNSGHWYICEYQDLPSGS